MRFGGHETFSIREGWLHKGLRLLIERPELYEDLYLADWLGVGRNMAKSIRYWLIATGLADVAGRQKSRLLWPLQASQLGRLVWTKDPYLAESGTWWALHINLINTPQQAASWSWFFNVFNVDRFERSICLESLRRYLETSKLRLPSNRTLSRDIACLLGSYAKSVPQDQVDPEEGHECPFAELGILRYFKTSGYYQVNRSFKEISAHLLGYSISCAFPETTRGETTADVALQSALTFPGAPGRVFALTGEALFDVAMRAEAADPRQDVQIAGLAGNRVLRVRRKEPLQWLADYYSSLDQKNRDAA